MGAILGSVIALLVGIATILNAEESTRKAIERNRNSRLLDWIVSMGVVDDRGDSREEFRRGVFIHKLIGIVAVLIGLFGLIRLTSVPNAVASALPPASESTGPGWFFMIFGSVSLWSNVFSKKFRPAKGSVRVVLAILSAFFIGLGGILIWHGNAN